MSIPAGPYHRGDPYILTQEDVMAIKRFIKAVIARGAKMASIDMNNRDFEVGFSINPMSMLPTAYGSGRTIAAAINEALAEPKAKP